MRKKAGFIRCIYTLCSQPVHLSLSLSLSLVAFVQQMFLFEFCLPYTSEHCDSSSSSSSSLISADEARTNKNRKTKRASLVCFVLRTSDLFFETHIQRERERGRQTRKCGGVLSFLTLRSSWPKFYFVFVFLWNFICWGVGTTYTQTLEIVSLPIEGPRKIGFYSFMGRII